jgi:hypothetical protein
MSGKQERMRKKFRPDLSEYLIYVQALADKLNEDALLKMSLTDAVKIAIEKACEKVLPDVVIVKKRKLYQRLEF